MSIGGLLISKEMIGRYEIIRAIAEGSTSTIYLAYCPKLHRRVVVKVLRETVCHDEIYQKRFMREVSVVASLRHAHIVPILDFGIDHETPYMVMPYFPGGSLQQHLALHRPDLHQAIRFFLSIANAVAYAHSRNVVHRDIKPANCIRDDAGNWLLCDFSIASIKNLTSNLTNTYGMVGTPRYMSPEQTQGDSDERSDIYSLGILFYELLAGTPPFSAESVHALISQHLFTNPKCLREINPLVPATIERIVAKALEKNPDDRFQTVTELTKALRNTSRR